MNVKITGTATLASATRHWVGDCGDATPDLLWICHDTPIKEDGTPDNDGVLELIQNDILVAPDIPVLISCQIRSGTMSALSRRFPGSYLAYQPENIRVASANSDFGHQSRIVVGRPDERYDGMLAELLNPYTSNLIFTDWATAEMVKHSLNCWLGMNIAFINEIARVCERVGADANVVSCSLLTERRISPHAPLRPGAPFGLGHLARDIHSVSSIAKDNGVSVPIISRILESNNVKTKSM